MRTLNLTEAVVFALEHLPGELTGVWTSGSHASVSMKYKGDVYTCNIASGASHVIAEQIRERRGRLWTEMERAGKL